LRGEIGVVQHVGLGLEEVDLIQRLGDLGLRVNCVLKAHGVGVEAGDDGGDEGQDASYAGCDGKRAISSHFLTIGEVLGESLIALIVAGWVGGALLSLEVQNDRPPCMQEAQHSIGTLYS
jgi:hypothetical protein